MVIASTGHISAASLQLQVAHLPGAFTYALSSLSSKTSGHISTHEPHPIQVSQSTTGFFIYLPLIISLDFFKILNEFTYLHAKINTLDPIHAFISIFPVKICGEFMRIFFEFY